MASDAQGLIVLWNPACTRMFGYTEADALGKSLDLIIPQRQQKPHWDGYNKTMATGITKYGNDVLRVPAMHKDGHTLSIAFTVSMLHNPDGSVSAIIAVIRDALGRLRILAFVGGHAGGDHVQDFWITREGIQALESAPRLPGERRGVAGREPLGLWPRRV